MKKLVYRICMMVILIGVTALTSCITYALSTAAEVRIHVVDPYGYAVKGEMVYMYNSSFATDYNLATAAEAIQMAETDSYGYAEFNIRELDLMTSYKKAFVFATLEGSGDMNRHMGGRITVAVKEGDKLEKTLRIGQYN